MTYAADAKEPFIFGVDMNYLPFESIKDSQPTGINVDILRAMSKAMDKDIDIRLMEWSEAQQMVIDKGSCFWVELPLIESNDSLSEQKDDDHQSTPV